MMFEFEASHQTSVCVGVCQRADKLLNCHVGTCLITVCLTAQTFRSLFALSTSLFLAVPPEALRSLSLFLQLVALVLSSWAGIQHDRAVSAGLVHGSFVSGNAWSFSVPKEPHNSVLHHLACFASLWHANCTLCFYTFNSFTTNNNLFTSLVNIFQNIPYSIPYHIRLISLLPSSHYFHFVF